MATGQEMVIWNGPRYAQLARDIEAYAGREQRKEMLNAITRQAYPIRDAMRARLSGGRQQAKPTRKSRRDKTAKSQRVTSAQRRRAEYNLSRLKSYEDAVANARFTGAAGRRKVEAIERRELGKASLKATLSRKTYLQVNNRATGRRAGVRIKTKNSLLPTDQQVLPRLMNRGRWRHPVFGNRDVWVEQTTTARGWWTNTLRDRREDVLKAIQTEFAEWSKTLEKAIERAGREGLPKQQQAIGSLGKYR